MKNILRKSRCWILFVLLVVPADHGFAWQGDGQGGGQGDGPLFSRIDAMVRGGAELPVQGVAEDAAFVRRIYLDLLGRVPSVEEARGFLSDETADKRSLLIDRLLAHAEFDRHMTDWLDVMLMERRPATHSNADLWSQHLYDAFAANRPLHELLGEILAADGTADASRHLARFTLDREVEPHELTRDVGRIFFGRDLQCAQCHDHPLIDGYRQQEYHELFAFFSRASKLTTKKGDKDHILISETAEGDHSFTSVFEKRWSVSVQPSLPGGSPIDDPALAADKRYKVPPAKGKQAVPTYSRRAKLAELIGQGSNRWFAKNMANRLWAMMMGRGIIEPLDLSHPGNPPMHPQLLESLTDSLIAMNFDTRAFLRQIALSQTYQASFDASPLHEQQEHWTKIASQEGQWQEKLDEVIAAFEQADDRWVSAMDEWGESKIALKKSDAEFAASTKLLGEAKANYEKAAAQLANTQAQLEAATQMRDTLQSAAAHAQAAVKLQEQLQPLVEAASLLSKRSQQAVADADALVQTLATQKTIVASLQKQLAETEAAHQPLAATHGQVVAEELATRQKSDLAFEERNTLDVSLTQLQRRKQVVQNTHAFLLAQQTLASVHAAEQATGAEVAEAGKVLAELEQREAATLALAAESQRGAAAAEQTVADAAAALGSLELALSSVNEAHDALVAAQGKAADAADFSETINKTASRQSELSERLAAARATHSARQAAAKPAMQAYANATTMRNELQAQIDSARGTLSAANERLAKAMRESASVREAFASAQNLLKQKMAKRFLIRPLEPLSPEELAWSTMEATGVTESYRNAARAELEKEAAEIEKKNAEATEEKDKKPVPVIDDRAIERRVYTKLKGTVNLFVNMFGSGAGLPQLDGESTIDQSLFMANNGSIQNWVKPHNGYLVGRLSKLTDAKAIADELYLTVFTRYPTPEEQQQVAAYLEGRTPEDRVKALSEMAWALLTSTEFRFNH